MRAARCRSPLVWLTVIALLAGCGMAAPDSTPASTSPRPTQAPASSTAAATPVPTAPSPTGEPTPTPVEPSDLPVLSGGVGMWTRMTVMPDGGLLVRVHAPDGDVLVLLDRDGRAVPGWPVRLVGQTECSEPVALADGSIRVVCGDEDRDAVAIALDAHGETLPGWPVRLADGSCYSGLRALDDGSVRIVCWRRSATDTDAPKYVVFALDAMGNTIPGWPVIPEVDIDPTTQRIVGDQLMLLGQGWSLVAIDRAGVVRSGGDVPGDWEVGLSPDGTAYVIEHIPDWVSAAAGWIADAGGRITAFDLAGVRPGWPVSFKGMGSMPAFGPDGRVYLTVGTIVNEDESTSRVLAFDPDGGSVSASSPVLKIATADPGVDCAGGAPSAPTIAADGTVFVWSIEDPTIYALDPSLKVNDGWPYVQPVGSPPDECGDVDGLCCSWSLDTARAVGPDGSLYLALQRTTGTVGGGITAIEPDGRVRPGWPVVLRRPEAMFVAVEVGGDGVVYALATEPEAGGGTSGTILAIEPDGQVRYRTSIAEP